MDTDTLEGNIEKINVVIDGIVEKIDCVTENLDIEFDFSIPFSEREINFKTLL